MKKLTREIILPAPIDSVFAFFSNARNLERITPPWLHFRILSQSTPEIGEGTIFRYRLRIHGVPVFWTSRIERWKKNEAFIDTQLKGPYRTWIHLHTFEPHASGGTRMTDTVDYEPLFGRFGELLVGFWVTKQVEEIFDYRARVISEIFQSTAP